MPKIEQINWDNLRPQKKIGKTSDVGTKNFANVEYKEPRKNSKHGAVKTIRQAVIPHPFKCSKCDYVATSIKDSKNHWLDHD